MMTETDVVKTRHRLAGVFVGLYIVSRLRCDYQRSKSSARAPKSGVALAVTSPETDATSQRSVTRGSLGESAFVASGTQSFHLSAQRNHSLSNAFVFLRGACDRTVDCALVDKALKFFISTQAQHLFAATGCVSLPQIEQNNFE